MTKHITRLIHAIKYSCRGFKSAWQNEMAFQLEIILSLILIPTALWLGQTPIENILLISSWILVLIIELINSAIEAAIDRIGQEQHELSGRAKDLGSAAVMLTVCLMATTWGTILYNHVLN